MTDELEDRLIAQVEYSLLHPGELQPGTRVRARTMMQFLNILISPGQLGIVVSQKGDGVFVTWDDDSERQTKTVLRSTLEEI